MDKYQSPFPGRQITGQDFADLVKYINMVIENGNLTEEKQQEILNRIEQLNKDTNEKLSTFQLEIQKAQKLIDTTNAKQSEFSSKLDNFYSKQIEIFGLFVAIFSFIIAGIQIATKVEGTFINKLETSAAIFLPVTLAITVLFLLIRRLIKSKSKG